MKQKFMIITNFIIQRKEIELQDAGYPTSSPSQIPVVDAPGSVEYEEIVKFQEGIEENPVMIEPHPPKGDYMNTLSVLRMHQHRFLCFLHKISRTVQ